MDCSSIRKIFIPGVLYIRQGKIIGITQSLEDRPKEIVDAKGLYILPGAIDGHVHMMDPGYPEREDFITGTKAAARGGVTTVIDHHRTLPQVFGVEEFLKKRKNKYLEGRDMKRTLKESEFKKIVKEVKAAKK